MDKIKIIEKKKRAPPAPGVRRRDEWPHTCGAFFVAMVSKVAPNSIA